MILGMNSIRSESEESSSRTATARRLRHLVAAGGAEELLRRCVPAFRDGVWSPRDVRFERYPWKGAVAVEGTLSLDPGTADAGGLHVSSRYSFRVTPLETGPGPDTNRARDLFVGYDEEQEVEVRVSPADPALPALEEALAGRSPLGPLRDVSLLGHRFGRRAALRARTASGDPVIVKLFSKRRADRVAATLEPVSDPESARMPRVLGVARDGRSIVLEFLPGRVLHDHWGQVTPADLESVGRAVRCLARESTLPTASWAVMDEVSTILRFTERLRLFDRPLADEIQRRTDLVPRHTCGSGPVRLHRDLHDRQIVLRDGAPGIVDWDLAAAGAPEIDAANFVSHLALRAMQGRLPADRVPALRAAFLGGYLGKSACSDGLALWERMTLLRLACVYALRPVQPGIAARLLQAHDTLEAAE